MSCSKTDGRSPQRRTRDEQIAAEPRLAVPDFSGDAVALPMEAHLPPQRPRAVVGVVENGLVRPIDPAVTLPEHSRVIIVASERM
jgi:hypothetical protein